MKTVTFLFPRTGEEPIGGFKIIYEYGNRLAAMGVKVNYVYGIVSRKDLNGFVFLLYCVARIFRFIRYKVFKSYLPDSWFKTDSSSSHILCYSLAECFIPKSDVIVASSWATAYWLNDYKNIDVEKKFYFIQHFEDWHGGKDKVLYTWKMKLRKMVIAPWLLDIAHNIGEDAELVENAFNMDEFYITSGLETRDSSTVIMLWHDNPFKGCEVGLKALRLVKKQVPTLHVLFFGVPERPSDLPDWIEYHQKPSVSTLRSLYNRASIFVGTSFSEGWGLTLGEAMLCGCSVACTDNPGYKILAHQNKTALLSPVGDYIALSENIVTLVNNSPLRNSLSQSGTRYALTFTWERSFKKFHNTIFS